MIQTFTHVKNGKTMYAVTNENSDANALDTVRRYQKKGTSFMSEHNVCDGTIYNKKLYVGSINRKKTTPCKIVYRKTIDISEFE